MSMVEIVFSPTGGTEKVADKLTARLAECCDIADRQVVDLVNPAFNAHLVEISSDDVVAIAVPSFGGRMPSTAAERLSQINGHGATAILVCVYGNRAFEDTLVELEDVAHGAGFVVVAAVAAIAEHSIVRSVAAGRPDTADFEELTSFADRIAERLQMCATGEAVESPTIPGNRPYKEAGGSGMVPKASKACVNCGICAKACPVQAIDAEDCHKVDSERCISCMRCVSVCPHNARAVSAVMLATVSTVLKKACADRRENELFL